MKRIKELILGFLSNVEAISKNLAAIASLIQEISATLSSICMYLETFAENSKVSASSNVRLVEIMEDQASIRNVGTSKSGIAQSFFGLFRESPRTIMELTTPIVISKAEMLKIAKDAGYSVSEIENYSKLDKGLKIERQLFSIEKRGKGDSGNTCLLFSVENTYEGEAKDPIEYVFNNLASSKIVNCAGNVSAKKALEILLSFEKKEKPVTPVIPDLSKEQLEELLRLKGIDLPYLEPNTSIDG